MAVWTSQSLEGAADPARYLPYVLPWVHEAGNPYFDWFFGDPGTADRVLRAWMLRDSSEVSLRRVTILRRGPVIVGGIIAMGAPTLLDCRRNDALALGRELQEEARAGVVARLRRSAGMFPQPRRDQFYLSKMGLLASERGKGYGMRLVEEYLAQARRLGFRRLRLDVARENDVAVRLYRRAGFREEPGPPGEGPVRYVSMTRPLRPMRRDTVARRPSARR